MGNRGRPRARGGQLYYVIMTSLHNTIDRAYSRVYAILSMAILSLLI